MFQQHSEIVFGIVPQIWGFDSSTKHMIQPNSIWTSGTKVRIKVWRFRILIRYPKQDNMFANTHKHNFRLMKTIRASCKIFVKVTRVKVRASLWSKKYGNSIIHITRTIRYTSGIWSTCKNCKTSSPVEVKFLSAALQVNYNTQINNLHCINVPKY